MRSLASETNGRLHDALSCGVFVLVNEIGHRDHAAEFLAVTHGVIEEHTRLDDVFAAFDDGVADDLAVLDDCLLYTSRCV